MFAFQAFPQFPVGSQCRGGVARSNAGTHQFLAGDFMRRVYLDERACDALDGLDLQRGVAELRLEPSDQQLAHAFPLYRQPAAEGRIDIVIAAQKRIRDAGFGDERVCRVAFSTSVPQVVAGEPHDSTVSSPQNV